MESGSDDQFEEIRCEVCGVLTDQGAEKSIADQSVNVLPAFKDKYPSTNARSYLWPSALGVLGHMHILFNALEEAIKAISISDSFFDGLKAYTGFLGDVALRGKFQRFCLNGKHCVGLFNSFRSPSYRLAMGILMPRSRMHSPCIRAFGRELEPSSHVDE